MKKLVMSKKLVISVLLIIVIAVPSSVYGYNNYSFNKLYNCGVELLNKENFEDAINAFNSSLKYKQSQKELIENKINLAKYLRNSKAVFDLAVTLKNEKKYLDAIDTFKKVKSEDTSRYSDAQNKIKECGDSYIKENLDYANNMASNKNYDKAIAYLDTILMFDNNNKDAQALKDEYNKDIRQIAEEAAKAKEAEAAKLAAQNTAKSTSTAKTTNSTTNTSNNLPATSTSTTTVTTPQQPADPYTAFFADAKLLFKTSTNGYLDIIAGSRPGFNDFDTYPVYDLEIYLKGDRIYFYMKNMIPPLPIYRSSSYYVTVKSQKTGQVIYTYTPQN